MQTTTNLLKTRNHLLQSTPPPTTIKTKIKYCKHTERNLPTRKVGCFDARLRSESLGSYESKKQIIQTTEILLKSMSFYLWVHRHRGTPV